MALIDVIKWESSTSELAHCCEIDDITLGSQLVVGPAQTAVFVRGGMIFDEFGPGTHTLTTYNLPLLKHLTAAPFGGVSPFQAQVWFVNGISLLDGKWGTQTPIQIEDPKYGVIVPVRAYGQYGFHVSDPRTFLERLIGNMPSFATAQVAEYFRGVILSKLTGIVSDKMCADGMSVTGINTRVEELSDYALERLRPEFAAYGIELEIFRVISVSVNESDPSFRRLKEAKDALARITIMGRDNYRLERSFDVLDSAAGNEGGAVGAAVGLGAGLSFGREISALAIGQMAAADTPPPLPGAAQAAAPIYLGIDGRQEGPMDTEAVTAAFMAGRIGPRTLAWRRGMAAWTPLADMPEFAFMCHDCPPPLPHE